MISFKRDFGLDIARALAIMLVFFGHSLGTVGVTLGLFWYIPALGVDIFFALSGFLIGKILISLMAKNNGHLSIKQVLVFLYRRLLRTAPLYWVALGLHFFVDKFVFKNGILFNWKFFFWLQYLQLPKQKNPFFGESWSLCVEELFYFTFPIGLFLFTKATYTWQIYYRHKMAIFTLSFIFISICIRLLFCGSSPNSVLTQYRLDAIGYGVLASTLHYCYNIKIRNILIGFGGLIFLPVGIILYVKGLKLPFLLHISYAIIGLGASLSILFIKRANLNATLFFAKAITFLSKISYSIYLSNLVIIRLAVMFLRKNVNSLLFFFLLLFFEIVFSTITYYLIELPFLKNRDRFLQMLHLKKTTLFFK